MFGLEFVFDEIPNKLLPFDWDTFHAYQGKVLVGVTNAVTGQAEYFDGMQLDLPCTMLRATCAIPFYFPAILIDGTFYYDGGLAGRRKDHQLRQAGGAHEKAGQAASAGRLRCLPSRRHPPVGGGGGIDAIGVSVI